MKKVFSTKTKRLPDYHKTDNLFTSGDCIDKGSIDFDGRRVDWLLDFDDPLHGRRVAG